MVVSAQMERDRDNAKDSIRLTKSLSWQSLPSCGSELSQSVCLRASHSTLFEQEWLYLFYFCLPLDMSCKGQNLSFKLLPLKIEIKKKKKKLKAQSFTNRTTSDNLIPISRSWTSSLSTIQWIKHQHTMGSRAVLAHVFL